MTDKYLEIAIIPPGEVGGRPKSERSTQKWEANLKVGGQTKKWEAGKKVGGRPKSGRPTKKWEVDLKVGADEEERHLKTDLWWVVERAESDIRLTNGRTCS